MQRKILILSVLLSVAGFRVQASGFLDNEDRQIIATCLVLEAGGEGAEGMQAVLNVILNRSGGYLQRMVPETIKYGAFSCMEPIWHTDSPDYNQLVQRAMSQTGAYDEALQLVALMEEGFLWDNTCGATHYHAASIHPYWADSLRYLTTIGNHLFYVEPGRQVASL